MVGLARNKHMIAAAIYDPNHDELIYAERGKGAHLNGKRIYVSQNQSLPLSYGTTSAIFSLQRAHWLYAIIKGLHGKEIWLNNLGSIAMNALTLSSGKRDWFLSTGEKLWDYAAPSLIISEAGGRVTDMHGKEWSWKSKQMLAANPLLHKKLLKAIQ